MRILAFDTCFDGCSACVAGLRGGAVSILSARFERFETGHAERLIPMIAEAMHEAQIPFERLDRIVVTTGPGTFTGTRIGVAAARALALATGARTVGVSSLAVMAEVARRDAGRIGSFGALAVVVDARRGEAYTQAFGPGGGADAVSPPALLSLEDAADAGGEGAVLFVGSAAEAAAAIATRRGRVAKALLPHLVPDAVALVHLGALLPGSDVPVAPLYLRPPDAKPQDGKAVARA